MFTPHSSRRLPIRSEREHRLCAQYTSPDHAHEVLTAAQRLERNKEIHRFLELFTNRPMRTQFPELSGDRPLDRAYFLALLFGRSLDLSRDHNYGAVGRADMDIVRVLGLEEELRARDYLAIGRWLKDNMPADFLNQIPPGGGAVNTSTDTGLRTLGQAFADRLRAARGEWLPSDNRPGTISDQVVLRACIERYRSVRDQLNTALQSNRIRVPGLESGDASLLAGEQAHLTRQEYFMLMALLWEGRITIGEVTTYSLEPLDAAEQKSIEAFRAAFDPVYALTAPEVPDIPSVTKALAPAQKIFGTMTDRARRAVVRELNEYYANVRYVFSIAAGNQLRLSDRRVNLTAALERGVEGTQAFLKVHAAELPVARQNRIYSDMAHEEMGPQESLDSMGITLGGSLRTNYLLLLQGRTPELSHSIDPETKKMLSTMRITDRASTWIHAEKDRNKARYVHAFLTHSMVATSGNARFLESLRYHLVFGDKERAEQLGKLPSYTPPFNRVDTMAVLQLIIQSLSEAEAPFVNFREQEKELREKLSSAQTVEKFAGDAWEYIRNIGEHPVGSILMATAGIIVVMSAWKLLFGKKTSNFARFATYAAVIGVGVGLYQQSRRGRAWWEGVWGQVQGWMGRERTLEPQEQTLPNYWYRQLALGKTLTEYNQTQEVTALSVLHEVPIRDVLQFYESMDKAKRAGGTRPYENHPFRIDSRLRRNLGNLDRRQQSELFYSVLKEFFKERGRFVRSQYPSYSTKTDVSRDDSDAALGFSYINERYVSNTFFRGIVEGGIVIGGIRINALTITNMNDPLVKKEMERLAKSHPALHAVLMQIRHGYQAEERRRETGNWPMSMAFYFEANPEILRRMGDRARQPADTLEYIYDNISKVVGENTPFQPPPPDRAERIKLFEEEEKKVIASLQSTHLAWAERVSTRPAIIAAVQADAQAFSGRLPVEPDARKPLIERLRSYIDAQAKAGTSIANLVNEVERRKNLLLITTMRSNHRLTRAEIEGLDLDDRTSWPAWADRIVDWVWFDRAGFPDINSLSDVSALFNSETVQKGGVAWYQVWLRMFPAWQQHDFHILENTVNRHRRRFRRWHDHPIAFTVVPTPAAKSAIAAIALNPALALVPGAMPAAEGLRPAEIDALEQYVARRFSNRLLEAMLITHRRDLMLRTTPDEAAKRSVTKTEMENLATYLDHLVSHLVDTERLDKRLEAFEKKKQELAKLTWEYSGISGNLYSGRMEVRNTGVADEFTVGMNYGTVASSRILYPMTMRTEEMLRLSANEIFERWKDSAVKAHILALQNHNTTLPPNQRTPHVVRSGDSVEVGINNSPHARANPVALIQLRYFLVTSPREINSRYNTWQASYRNNNTNGRNPLE